MARREVVQDLSGLLVAVGTAYVAAKVSAHQGARQQSNWIGQPLNSPNVGATRPLTMYRPVFCNSYANVNSVGETLYLRVNQFCY